MKDDKETTELQSMMKVIPNEEEVAVDAIPLVTKPPSINFAINLDDYQLDPLTPPPSPSSPFTMAAYQRMIAETDPTQREEALTEISQNSVMLHETA
ncbi:hypothetical protein Tco_0196335 [Tanacetum coccineum]|uniref:Uncharacterized protein n=1 Tax=Tanacetum coccineum TaxID=301880 RepID=A0ABQ5AD42_9ASTR